MNDRIEFYARSQLLGAGFLIIDGVIAHRLSGGLWPSAMAATMDFSRLQAIVDKYSAGAFTLTVQIEDRSVTVIARSMASLAQRIENITGLKVSKPKAVDVELGKEISISEAVEHFAEIKVDRVTARRLRMQEQAARNEALRSERLEEAARHAEWVASSRQQAAQSRSAHFEAKRGGGHG